MAQPEGPPSPEQGGEAASSAAQAARKATSHLRHELRTPINQIIGYSELLQEEAQDLGQESLVADLGKITLAGRRLLDLVESGLDALLVGHAVPHIEPAAVAVEAAAQEASADESAVAAADAADAAGPHMGASLLVVDDDVANRDMLARRLRRNGHQVVTAGDGEAALAVLGARTFDLVLLDVVMPGINGLEVLKRVRQQHAATDLPVIMATGRDGSEDTVAALHLGANDYVTKPLDFPVVQARVQTHLGLKRAMEEVRRLASALELRNGFIRRLFGRYVSDEVVSTLLETPQGLRLGGEKRTVTIMMADLRGFSSMAERLPPEQVVATLNNFLGAMTDIITAHRGTIDEFIGDAILALFGAPIGGDDDARRAVACAVEMQLAMEQVNARNRSLSLPDIQMGIGLNTGEVVVGNVGSQKRAKYGVVGSPVNMAGRIESYTVGGQILISDATRRDAGADVAVDNPIEIQAKGFALPVTAYTLRGLGGVMLPSLDEEMAPPARELHLQFAVLEGKHGAGPERAGRMVRVSHRGCEIEAEEAVEALRDLRLRVTGFHGTEVPGDLYAKVLSTDAAARRFVVRFTSVPPEVAELLKAATRATVS
jgi:adenylate cyclase